MQFSCSKDGCVRVWDLDRETGRCLRMWNDSDRATGQRIIPVPMPLDRNGKPANKGVHGLCVYDSGKSIIVATDDTLEFGSVIGADDARNEYGQGPYIEWKQTE